MDDMQWGVPGGSGEDKETVNQNIILINRQRQVNWEHFQEALLMFKKGFNLLKGQFLYFGLNL